MGAGPEPSRGPDLIGGFSVDGAHAVSRCGEAGRNRDCLRPLRRLSWQALGTLVATWSLHDPLK